MPRNWIAVASADHVRRGLAGGFMQVCHGKAAPLRLLKPGDRVAYYSPVERFGGSDRLQAFTAIGFVADDIVVQVDVGGGFHPFRRTVTWARGYTAPMRPLLNHPEFVLSGPGWGARLRYGLLEIDPASMDAIATAMGATLDATRADDGPQELALQVTGSGMATLAAGRA